MIAKVRIRDIPLGLDKLYDYAIPRDLVGRLEPGQRVLIPFGKNNRRSEAMIWQLCDHPDDPDLPLKEIYALIDREGVLSIEQLSVCEFVASRFFCTCYDAVRVCLPAGSSFREHRRVQPDELCPDFVLDRLLQNEENAQVMALVRERGEQGLDEKDTALLDDAQRRALTRLIRAGALRLAYERASQVRQKEQRLFRLAKPDQDGYQPTQAGQRVLLALSSGPMTATALCSAAGCTIAVIKTLEKYGKVISFTDRVTQDDEEICTEPLSALNDEQQSALQHLAALMDYTQARCSLLHGVTGSGKTVVFLHLIQKARSDGKGALVLVPEIALTPQMRAQFERAFGSEVAVLHSGLSDRQRFDAWQGVKAGKYPIVVGTRSAVFAPIQNLGVILVDEEQESSYQSEQTPRYDAVEVAKYRCKEQHALLVLSSATPSLAAKQAAVSGQIDQVLLARRYNNQALPSVTLADLTVHVRSGSRSLFTSQLLIGLREAVENGHQAILFLNRRGFSTYVACKECGYVAACPNCSISLTFHRDTDKLHCHYCGHTQRVSERCPDCGGEYLRFSGAGTQKVEQELQTLMPHLRIMRLDADTTASRGGHDRVLSAFGRCEADVLIGTQMVVKGLDFPNVTFVGVLNADQALQIPDYRAGEMTFFQLAQVVGRAGRDSAPGRAVIQTYQVDHPIIQAAAVQNYDRFFAEETAQRRLMGYPPFLDLFVIGATGQDMGTLTQVLTRAKSLLQRALQQADISAQLLGPAPATIVRIKGSYRMRLIIKCKDSKAVRDVLWRYLRWQTGEPIARSVHVTIDHNPAQLG